eukprot:TRINITY_DN61485_c0_g1_i1.p1 TRINITY_DN61485_c0_g1~~TRINITY_DN61485_c0_g1_i1.p1  ORF type:complete len:309 (-),score=51.92 TRINITY_DN61485_c0_g1_i1:125-1051(-)
MAMAARVMGPSCRLLEPSTYLTITSNRFGMFRTSSALSTTRGIHTVASRHSLSAGTSTGSGRRPIVTSGSRFAPVVEMYKDGVSALEVWQDESGVLVAQHDDIQDIDGCKWALDRACHHMRELFTRTERTPNDLCGALMALRFLTDLGERVERLDKDGRSTCAVELFERPWLVTSCQKKAIAGGPLRHLRERMSKRTPLLQFRPRPDGVLKRAALAVLSPVVVPFGALVAYVRSGGESSQAALQWYFRAITEIPCHVKLEQGYEVDATICDRDDLAAAAATDGERRLVRGVARQLMVEFASPTPAVVA